MQSSGKGALAFGPPARPSGVDADERAAAYSMRKSVADANSVRYRVRRFDRICAAGSTLRKWRPDRSRGQVSMADVNLQDWIGRTECARGPCDRDAGRSAGRDARPRRPGAAAPATRCRRCGTGSTSCRCTGRAKLGPDGHARRGGFLPPVPLPRRMWAGGRLAFAPAAARRRRDRRAPRASPTSTTSRARSGPLVFVTVRHEIADARRRRRRRGARHRLSRRRRAPGERADRRSRRRPTPRSRARSCPTTCCCFAIRR